MLEAAAARVSSPWGGTTRCLPFPRRAFALVVSGFVTVRSVESEVGWDDC